MTNILKEIGIILTTQFFSLKTVASSIPTVLSLDNGDTITNRYNIAYTFNTYFASIAQTTKKHKTFT